MQRTIPLGVHDGEGAGARCRNGQHDSVRVYYGPLRFITLAGADILVRSK